MTRHRDGLLPRMEARVWADGTTVSYRYHPLGGKPVALGTDREAALRKVLDMLGRTDAHGTMSWLWDRFCEGKRWQRLAEGTRADYTLAWKQIDARFGSMPASAITPPMVARYVHIERAESPRRADIEKALMSGVFKHGILLGVCTTNPTIGVEPHGSEASTVMPEAKVLAAFVAWLEAQGPQRQVLARMAEFAALAGSRRVEFLDLTWFQVDRAAGEIRVERAKQRGKKKGKVIDIIQITPPMAALLDRVKALGRDGQLLFPDRDGNIYGTRAWKSLWQRCMLGAMTAGVVPADARFNFHALRRYYVTYHKSKYDRLPDIHANPAVTAAVYDGTREVRRKSL